MGRPNRVWYALSPSEQHNASWPEKPQVSTHTQEDSGNCFMCFYPLFFKCLFSLAYAQYLTRCKQCGQNHRFWNMSHFQQSKRSNDSYRHVRLDGARSHLQRKMLEKSRCLVKEFLFVFFWIIATNIFKKGLTVWFYGNCSREKLRIAIKVTEQ